MELEIEIGNWGFNLGTEIEDWVLKLEIGD